VIRFSDGTELPISWVYADAPEFEWQIEREHWPEPLTPMETWIWQNGQSGADRAWQELALEPPLAFSRFQTAGPFLYVNVTEPTPERIAAMAPSYMAVAQKYGRALTLWTEHCEPRIRQACADIAAMDATVDLRSAAELLFYGFHQTFTSLVLLFLPNMQLTALLSQFDIADEELTRFELTQGGDNATQAIDEEIFNLAEIARATPAVSKILHSGADGALAALRREPGAQTFLSKFDAMIDRHGSRSLGWMLMLPTWGEHPESALALVRAQVLSERTSPDELRKRTSARRDEATERVLKALPPEKHDELRSIIASLDGYVRVREGRAYLQLVIAGEFRGLLLRVGEGLARRRQVDRADDIFFVTPDELKGDTSNLRELVASRRAEWERWRAIEPPVVIGTPGKAAAEAEAKRAEFKGSPASRGVATGAVRVLHSPDEGDKLQHGDILVCVLTTPAWTPLFAIAGGIITETGGALSHPAITAREYGIPAVTALVGATTKLKDGQRVTIDGTTGAVTPV
jgi:pyruvate,water dikinase